jgi:hypothetical protein
MYFKLYIKSSGSIESTVFIVGKAIGRFDRNELQLLYLTAKYKSMNPIPLIALCRAHLGRLSNLDPAVMLHVSHLPSTSNECSFSCSPKLDNFQCEQALFMPLYHPGPHSKRSIDDEFKHKHLFTVEVWSHCSEAKPSCTKQESL